MEKKIINRVANSPLVTIDLEELYTEGERVLFDLKDNLYQGLILREKDFRNFIKSHDWTYYQGKHVAVYCSVDAIIPKWAYMLLVSKLEPYTNTVIYGNLEHLEEELFRIALKRINPVDYTNKKVVIKGCSRIEVPTSIYAEITRLIRPYVSSIMYGEPCSTVPVYKAPKTL
ncbi:MAG: DUF2480 family protein [Cytophagales bacterium]|nr:DUF2480 family protein [Cytophagales bacterium]